MMVRSSSPNDHGSWLIHDMQSETLKYLYLLFSGGNVLPLTGWLLINAPSSVTYVGCAFRPCFQYRSSSVPCLDTGFSYCIFMIARTFRLIRSSKLPSGNIGSSFLLDSIAEARNLASLRRTAALPRCKWQAFPDLCARQRSLIKIDCVTRGFTASQMEVLALQSAVCDRDWCGQTKCRPVCLLAWRAVLIYLSTTKALPIPSPALLIRSLFDCCA